MSVQAAVDQVLTSLLKAFSTTVCQLLTDRHVTD